ncbi:hypothetical protein ACQ86N_34835 [Puia sp. P3]|uniref:hypothetical protein n=1 Tax=Puia sp. P3 TaxID=3423952 RepID=UPI003D669879
MKVGVVSDFDKLYGADVVSSTEEIFYLKFSRSTPGQGLAISDICVLSQLGGIILRGILYVL